MPELAAPTERGRRDAMETLERIDLCMKASRVRQEDRTPIVHDTRLTLVNWTDREHAHHDPDEHSHCPGEGSSTYVKLDLAERSEQKPSIYTSRCFGDSGARLLDSGTSRN